MAFEPVVRRSGEPAPLKPIAIGNVSRAAQEQQTINGILTDQKARAARSAKGLSQLREGIERKFRRQDRNGLAIGKPLPNLVDYTAGAGIR